MADKYITQVAGTLTEVEATDSSAGAGSAGEIVALDSNGRIDSSMMPVGIGADTASIEASENLAAGDFVNIHNSTGAKVRKADASTAGKHAHGFVLSAVSSGANATVYFEGTNTQVTSMTPGDVFLSTTPGIATSTPPSSTGNVVQRLGVATGTTAINVEAGQPIVLA
ncbi:hypothetical protein [Nocardia farcinica]|uniref:hypothetical protein n=1 Tax=Nocardia farcinica TaxID=37329 RepID=UPI0024538141|nr:hypothetical protein [Nocardia farcinica]